MIAYRDFFKRTNSYVIVAMLLCVGMAHARWNPFASPKAQPEELLELTPKKKQSSLRIHHELAGTVNLHGWHQDHIAVSVHKHTRDADDAARISTTLTQTEHGVVTLTISESEELNKHAYVDITVHIPHKLATTVTAQESVTITQTDCKVRAETALGDITATDTSGPLHLATEKGDITVTTTRGSVTAHSKKGAITIKDSYQSVKAETARGSLTVVAAQLPSTARLELTTQKRGMLTLELPESAEAHLVADTTRGIITSNMLITLESHTMVLNSGSYQDMQRHIRGIVGQQGTADIKLSGTRDIHITTREII